MRLSITDVLIVIAYLSVIAYIAWQSRAFAGKSLENYFLAGRKMPGWLAGISYAASMQSADSAVGYGGMAVITGIFVCWFYLARFGLAFFIGAMLFAVYWRRLNTFTTLEFYELRFTRKPASLMRTWVAIRSSLIAIVAWTAISLLALVKIVEPVIGLSKNQTMLFVVPITLAYLYLSGYVGLVLSNLIQVIVMTLGTLVLALKVLWALGGAHQLGVRLSSAFGKGILFNLPPTHDSYFPLAAAVAWLIGTSIGYGGDAAPMSGAVEGQRILSTRSPKEACVMYLVTEISSFTMTWLVCVPCIAALVIWPELRSGRIDRELAYGMLMAKYLGPGFLGLVFVAMLAGVMAVVGDLLNFGSQVLMNDIYKRFWRPAASERHYFWAGRVCILIILGLSLIVAYKVQFLFSVAIFMVGFAAAELPANWAQWWWWRFNGWGRVTASFGGGTAYLTLTLFFPQIHWWTTVYLTMIVSTILWVGAALLTAPEPRSSLRTFYLRAKPMGWWGPVRNEVLVTNPNIMQETEDLGFKKIALGLLISSIGAFVVMCYIMAISDFYFGRNPLGIVLSVATIVSGLLFWFMFSPYVASLTTKEESAQPEGIAFGPELGLKRILTFGVGVIGLFSLVSGVFLTAGITREIGFAVAFLTGCLLLKLRPKACKSPGREAVQTHLNEN
ncbi:MAG: hypothetical protein EPN47_05330 [Acidobacteria bacterium]|nr:MAG: hypothetical protein EPN47_05330 [Acidobacteriota bacterium]